MPAHTGVTAGWSPASWRVAASLRAAVHYLQGDGWAAALPQIGAAGAVCAAYARTRARAPRMHEAYAPLATYLEAAGPSAPDASEVREVLARVEAAIMPGGANGNGSA